jgi:uncharacterized membrane protein (UPF0127 family)
MAAAHFLRPMLENDPGTCCLRAEGRETPLAQSLIPAFDSPSRRRGLLGRDSLADGAALIIAPSSAVHTFRMQFPIDLVYARRDGRVLKVRQAVPPNSMSGAWGAFAVIELPAGTIARVGLEVGDQLSIKAAD